MTYLIGITGGIGGGKSTVSYYLSETGATIIDTDRISHEVTLPGSDALDEIRTVFGASVFHEDGSLDRKAMAGVVFGDEEKLSLLNSILHPRIRRRWLKVAGECIEPFAFVVTPLLLENNLQRYFDEIWVVTADEDERIKRVMARDNTSRESVQRRMAHQIPESEKIDAADIVIDTSGGYETTLASTLKALADLKRRLGLEVA